MTKTVTFTKRKWIGLSYYRKCNAWKTELLIEEREHLLAYWVSGVIAPRILDLGNRWRLVVSFAPRPLYPKGKAPVNH
jgi:hypothetical protein